MYRWDDQVPLDRLVREEVARQLEHLDRLNRPVFTVRLLKLDLGLLDRFGDMGLGQNRRIKF